MSVLILRFPIALFLFVMAQHGAAAEPARQVVIYRPSNTTFYVKNGIGNESAQERPYGATGDIPLWADFSGKGTPVPAVYRKGNWLISAAGNAPPISITFGGQPGDIPLAADLDGDAVADLVIFRRGEWIVRGSRNPALTRIYNFGAAGGIHRCDQ